SLKKVLVCINKMDMVDYDQTVFESIKQDYLKLAERLEIKELDFIPVSALKGDNIVHKSDRLPWYEGASLMDYLENVDLEERKNQPWRFPVQWIVRPQTDDLHDYRGYAGRVLGEGLKLGEEVIVLPSGTRSSIKAIEINQEQLVQAENGQSVIIHLADDIDISRGDIIVSAAQPALTERNFEANICWFDNKALDTTQVYLLQNHTALTKIKIADILHKYDVNTQEQLFGEEIKLNDIGKVAVKAAQDVVFDLHKDFPENSQAIIIDPRTNLTVGALMIESIA